MEDEIYTIELNKEQLKIISNCLELVSRIMGGQITASVIYPFQDIMWKNDISPEMVDFHLKSIKQLLFPHLHVDAHHGPAEKAGDSSHLYEMYKQIEHLLQKEREINGNTSVNVHSFEPMKTTDKPLIKVYKSTELTRINRINNILEDEKKEES